MHDAFVMHVLQRTGDLPHEIPDGGLVKLKIVAFLILNQLLEVSPLRPLRHNDQLVVVNKRIDELDDVGVAQLFHDLHLTQALVALLLVSHVENLIANRPTFIFFNAKATPCSFSAR